MEKYMKSYLYKNTPNIINSSSSGGAFKKIVSCIGHDEKTIVYGAVWDENLRVVHSNSKSTEDLQPYSGSKYARSKMGATFNNVAVHLLDGLTVIFSGTPCQIAGLKKFLKIKKINSEKLYLVDIICHGTPSPVLLEDWIHSIEKKYKRKVTAVSFRDKQVGWIGYPTKVVFDNGKVIRCSYKSQEFMRLFFSHAVMGPSCYKCPFANMDRQSDITIGDFWGVESSYPDVVPGKGVSLILFNTEKGKDILKKMEITSGEDEVLIECTTDSFLQYQYNLNRPTEKPLIREEFWKDYKENGYDYVIRKYGISDGIGNLKYIVKSILSKLKLYNKVY